MIMQRESQAVPKVYVPVRADFDSNGNVIPKAIRWEDGRTYLIDRVIQIRRAESIPGGGMGDRYRVRINGRESYLYFERYVCPSEEKLGRWYMQRK